MTDVQKDGSAFLSFITEKITQRIGELDASIRESEQDIKRMHSYYWENYTEMDEYGYENYDNQQALFREMQSSDDNVRLRRRLVRMLDNPFFGRVDFCYEGDEEPEIFYIGIGNFAESAGHIPLIYDWRAPIASLFYDYEKGPASYEAPAGVLSGEITSRRQYKIRGGRIIYELESDIKIDDDVLMQELGGAGENRLKNIIRTIQKEQNAIIRNTTDRIMVIQGAAGSGKTSIALHRIAYLLYHDRGSLKSSNVLILSPNGIFSDYISQILPELGEENIREMTFDLYAYRQLKDKGSIRPGQISESTILRFINQMMIREQLTNNQDLRRYERPHINEVWCGDSSVGPYLKTADGKKHKVYIMALIDDASRFITGADVFFQDTFVNLMSVMKSAVAKYGTPKVFNFDNGSAYRNRQMELLAARIGSVIHYCRPYTPIQKAKIERWFRTLKDHWCASLDMNDFHTLDELRGSLQTYVHLYNQSAHSSLNGKSPQERFFSEPELIRRLPDDKISASFLLEIERRVSPDSVIVIDHVEYEVDYRFAKQRITLRYTPDLEEIFVVERDGSLSPIRLLNKQENASVKRDKVRLTGGED